jgi:magnesium-transporting ATPase (P-type)
VLRDRLVIMDDNFSSIVKSVLWGRSVYDNIRRFLQFQLNVNVVALVITFIGSVCGFGMPLKPVQLLWVNLVMDTLGALALATEAPTPDLLDRKPYGRHDSLITDYMWRNIGVQSMYALLPVAFPVLSLLPASVMSSTFPSSVSPFPLSSSPSLLFSSIFVAADSLLPVVQGRSGTGAGQASARLTLKALGGFSYQIIFCLVLLFVGHE